MDKINYTYNGNSGQSIDYEYDANGILTKDLNKGISNIEIVRTFTRSFQETQT